MLALWIEKNQNKNNFASVIVTVVCVLCVLCVCVCVLCVWRVSSAPAGQDVFVCGFAGALAGALTCGSVILQRNLHLDAIKLAKSTKFIKTKDD